MSFENVFKHLFILISFCKLHQITISNAHYIINKNGQDPQQPPNK